MEEGTKSLISNQDLCNIDLVFGLAQLSQINNKILSFYYFLKLETFLFKSQLLVDFLLIL